MLRSPASICRSRPNVLLVTSLRDGIAGGSASVDCAVAGLILTNGATAMVLAVAPTKWRRVNSIFLRIPICSISICSHFNDSPLASGPDRSEEHTSELQSLMRTSYAVFCLQKKKYAA